jgi:hypothetical protein
MSGQNENSSISAYRQNALSTEMLKMQFEALKELFPKINYKDFKNFTRNTGGALKFISYSNAPVISDILSSFAKGYGLWKIATEREAYLKQLQVEDAKATEKAKKAEELATQKTRWKKDLELFKIKQQEEHQDKEHAYKFLSDIVSKMSWEDKLKMLQNPESVGIERRSPMYKRVNVLNKIFGNNTYDVIRDKPTQADAERLGLE